MTYALPQLASIPRQKPCGHCGYGPLTEITGCPWRGADQRDCPERTDKRARFNLKAMAWSVAAAASAAATVWLTL